MCSLCENMYVCVYLFMYSRLHVHVLPLYIYTHTHTHTRTRTHTHTHTGGLGRVGGAKTACVLYIRTCMRVCVYTRHTHTHIRTCMCVCLYTSHTRTHTELGRVDGAKTGLCNSPRPPRRAREGVCPGANDRLGYWADVPSRVCPCASRGLVQTN
jgi:hypothetical protein